MLRGVSLTLASSPQLRPPHLQAQGSNKLHRQRKYWCHALWPMERKSPTNQSCPRPPRSRPCIHETGRRFETRYTRHTGEDDEYRVRVAATCRGPSLPQVAAGKQCVRYCGPFSCFCCLCSRDCGQLFTRAGRGCVHRSNRDTRKGFNQGNLGGVKRWQIRLGGRSDWGGI